MRDEAGDRSSCGKWCDQSDLLFHHYVLLPLTKSSPSICTHRIYELINALPTIMRKLVRRAKKPAKNEPLEFEGFVVQSLYLLWCIAYICTLIARCILAISDWEKEAWKQGINGRKEAVRRKDEARDDGAGGAGGTRSQMQGQDFHLNP